MQRTICGLAMAAMLLLLTATQSQAVPDKRFDEGTQTCRILTFYNSGWVSPGADIFKQSCKTCHYRDNDQGATFLHTGSKSMEGWNRVFSRRYPKCARTGEWDQLSQEELLQLNDYLYANAANTYDPYSAESCG